MQVDTAGEAAATAATIFVKLLCAAQPAPLCSSFSCLMFSAFEAFLEVSSDWRRSRVFYMLVGLSPAQYLDMLRGWTVMWTMVV